RDTVLDVDHVGTSHPPLPRSPVLVLVVLVHVISFPLVGLDARWTPRRGVTGQTVSNPRLDWGWTPVWTGVGHRSGLGLDTGLDWGWNAERPAPRGRAFRVFVSAGMAGWPPGPRSGRGRRPPG